MMSSSFPEISLLTNACPVAISGNIRFHIYSIKCTPEIPDDSHSLRNRIIQTKRAELE